MTDITNPVRDAVHEVGTKLKGLREDLRRAELSIKPLKMEIEKWEKVLEVMTSAARIADQPAEDRHRLTPESESQLRKIRPSGYWHNVILEAVGDGATKDDLYRKMAEISGETSKQKMYQAVYYEIHTTKNIEVVDDLYFPAKGGKIK